MLYTAVITSCSSAYPFGHRQQSLSYRHNTHITDWIYSILVKIRRVFLWRYELRSLAAYLECCLRENDVDVMHTVDSTADRRPLTVRVA